MALRPWIVGIVSTLTPLSHMVFKFSRMEKESSIFCQMSEKKFILEYVVESRKENGEW